MVDNEIGRTYSAIN